MKHIYYHRVENEKESLKSVLSSGFFTHCIVREVSYDYGRDIDVDKLNIALDLCHRHGVKPIFSRWGHKQKLDNGDISYLFQGSGHWIPLVQQIKAEAALYGCESCVDMEAYPHPQNAELRDLYVNGLTSQQYIDLNKAIMHTVINEGPLDYVLPSGYWWPDQNTMTNGTRKIGKTWISEHTYAQLESRWREAPYDIMGVKVTPDGFDSRGPEYPKFYTPEEVVEKFLNKDVFVYPDGGGLERTDYGERFSIAFNKARRTSSKSNFDNIVSNLEDLIAELKTWTT